MGLVSRDRRLGKMVVAVLGPSSLVVVLEGLGRVHEHLVGDEALQVEQKGRYVARHLVESGRDVCKEPIKYLAVIQIKSQLNAYPSIIIFV